MERPDITRPQFENDGLPVLQLTQDWIDYSKQLEARIRELGGERDSERTFAKEYNEERVKLIREVFALRTENDSLKGLLSRLAPIALQGKPVPVSMVDEIDAATLDA